MDLVGYFVIGCVLLCVSDAAPVDNTTGGTTSTPSNSTDKDANNEDYGSKHYYNHNYYGHNYGHHYHDYGHNDYDHHGEDMFGHVKTNLTNDANHDHIMNEYLNYGFSQHGHDNKTEGMLGKISKYLRNDAVPTLTSTSVTFLCLAVVMESQTL